MKRLRDRGHAQSVLADAALRDERAVRAEDVDLDLDDLELVRRRVLEDEVEVEQLGGLAVLDERRVRKERDGECEKQMRHPRFYAGARRKFVTARKLGTAHIGCMLNAVFLAALVLTSPAFREGQPMTESTVLNGLDCHGPNRSPALSGRTRRQARRASW